MSKSEKQMKQTLSQIESLRTRYSEMTGCVRRDPKVEAIILATCLAFSVSKEEILGYVKTQTVADARQVAMFYIYTHLRLGLREIGEAFSDRHHTTVLYAIRAVHDKVTDRQFSQRFTSVAGMLPPSPRCVKN